MADTLAITFGFVVVGLVLLAVLGAVKRREKFAFVAGIALLSLGPILVATVSVSTAVGGMIALIGFLTVAASTVPLLRQSPTTA